VVADADADGEVDATAATGETFSAFAVGDSDAFAKNAPAPIIAAVASTAITGRFLLTFVTAAEALSLSAISNHSGFFGSSVIFFLPYRS
jgi:hypothetical protein